MQIWPKIESLIFITFSLRTYFFFPWPLANFSYHKVRRTSRKRSQGCCCLCLISQQSCLPYLFLNYKVNVGDVNFRIVSIMHICLQTWCSIHVTFEKKDKEMRITHDLLSLNPTWDQKQHARLAIWLEKRRPQSSPKGLLIVWHTAVQIPGLNVGQKCCHSMWK